MSKLSFRARALDATKPLPIYLSEEIPDTADCSLINRAVPQMPTGMEKEEEAEHHLQQAIVAGTVIPTPEVYVIDNVDYYDRVYPEDYKMPRQLIYMQPFSMETDIPDYDMDSEDEQWINSQAGKLELTPDKFEEMMDRLEKGSGQTVVTLQEAKALIKEDDDLIIAVYDYWLNKRLKTQHPLIPHVRTEARHGVANHNPYIAFRRRTEKMQTRKNRKNDESSYEKMLKLKRDLTRAVTLLEMVKRREKSKRELLHLTIEVFEKRYQAGDYAGQIVSEALQQRPARPAFTPLFQPNSLSWNKEDPVLATLTRKERRQYKKRRHKSSCKSSHSAATGSATSLLNYPNAQGLSMEGEAGSSEDDIIQPASPSEGEEEDEGVFAFRRRKDCEYHAPVDNSDWPWCSNDEIDKRFRFYPTSIRNNKATGYRSLGPCRRRVGRGGRVILDRMSINDLRQLCRSMGYDPSQSIASPPRSSSNLSQSDTTGEPVGNPAGISGDPTPASAIPPASPEYDLPSLSCWHHFRPTTPELPLDLQDTSLDDLDNLNEESVEEAREEVDLSQFTNGLSNSCHVGLVVSNGERPLSYSVEGLMTDPVLYQNPLASHIDLPDDLVVLDEQNSELANTYYLMELNNELINDIGVETDSWFPSMDIDMESSSAVVVEDRVPQDFMHPSTSSHQHLPPAPRPESTKSSEEGRIKSEPETSQSHSDKVCKSDRTSGDSSIPGVANERTSSCSSNVQTTDRDDKENARVSPGGKETGNEEPLSVSENGGSIVDGSEERVAVDDPDRGSTVNSSRGLGSNNTPSIDIVNSDGVDTNSSFLRTSLDKSRTLVGSGGNAGSQLVHPVGKIYPGGPAIIRRLGRRIGSGGNNKPLGGDGTESEFKILMKQKGGVNGDGDTAGLLHRLKDLGDVDTLELYKTGEFAPDVDSMEFNNINRSSKNNQLHLTVNSNASSNNNSISVVTNSGPSTGKLGMSNGPPVIPIADCEQSSAHVVR